MGVFLEFWISATRLRAGYRLAAGKYGGILTDFQAKVKSKISHKDAKTRSSFDRINRIYTDCS